MNGLTTMQCINQQVAIASVSSSRVAASQATRANYLGNALPFKSKWPCRRLAVVKSCRKAHSVEVVRSALPAQAETKAGQSTVTAETAAAEFKLKVTTLNMLAPIYKRVPGGGRDARESNDEAMYMARNARIVDDILLASQSCLLCLQEYWHESAPLRALYEGQLAAAGYHTLITPRTNGRGDGLLMAARTDLFDVVHERGVPFNDCGDRVMQMMHLRPRAAAARAALPDLLAVNTHLLFPHNANSTLIRLREVFKILEFLQFYKQSAGLGPVHIVLCGDWNGTKRGQVYNFMRSQGFVSTYCECHADDADAASGWVSHLNHHGEQVGVDYIWLLNPSSQMGSLTADWRRAVLAMIEARLYEMGLGTDCERFLFFKNLAKQGQSQDRSPMTATASTGANVTGATTAGSSASEGAESSNPHHQMSGPAYAQGAALSLAASRGVGDSVRVRCEGEAAGASTADGISLEEFRQGICALGLTGEGSLGLLEGEIRDLMAVCDADGNGVIDMDEFCDWLGAGSMTAAYQKIREQNGIWEGAWEYSSLTTSTATLTCPWPPNGLMCEVRLDGSLACAADMVVESSELPEHMAKGTWPADFKDKYSDHAPLTSVLSLSL
eukprot:jgi/Mesvir1/27603/Mv07340-RA.1